MTNSYDYLKDHKLQTWDSYPFTGKTGTCNYKASSGITTVKSYTKVKGMDPDAMMAAVSKQPVSVAVSSTSSGFFFYGSGVIDSDCNQNVNHAVLMIGYGTENGQDYWLLKNSWGTSWGEKGFFKVLRTNQKGAGLCGVLSNLSSYPNV